jgi:tetratricopeptide (TPR) repeat protein
MRRWLVLFLLLAAVGCRPQAAPTMRTLRASGNDADVYLRSVADTLNDMPNALDLELLPAQPILTASTSKDGKEVRAICTQIPGQEDGSFVYLHVVDENAMFQTLKVKPGDIVRYYVNFDEEAAERNIEQRNALELRVRRLDSADPENVLILQGGLSGPVLEPQRIEIWRFSDKRMDAIRSMFATYRQDRQPPAGWEPSPDLGALRQIVERANQWLRNLPPTKEAWKVDPLVAKVSAEVKLPENAVAAKLSGDALKKATSTDELRDGGFSEAEARLLEQAVWCRDISQWARREAATDVDAAVALFDWTVRNLQLDADGDKAAVTVHHPWQALIYGHGTAAHRAWVFVELCRQQGIEAAVIQPSAGEGDKPAPLLAGALIDGEIYLFDPALGLPLPSAKGTLAVGTLKELAEKSELLREFDVEGGPEYLLTSEQLAEVTALIVASSSQLAQRSARLEAALLGEEYVTLAANANDLAERLKKVAHVGDAKLWAVPYQAIVDEAAMPNTKAQPYRALAVAEFAPFAERPLLWKARVLHFQGHKDIRVAERGDALAMPREGHDDALRLYQSPTVRPSDDNLAKEEPAKQEVYRLAKADASYWLGLLSYDRGNYGVAASWLGDRTLDRDPKGKWANGARYILARAYEADGKLDEAIKLLESDPEGAPQQHGNLVRAKRLKAKRDAGVTTEGTGSAGGL